MWLDAVTRREYAPREANWETFVDEWRKQALSTQTGNCSELSALAYRYLQEKGIQAGRILRCLSWQLEPRLRHPSTATRACRFMTSPNGAIALSSATRCTTAPATPASLPPWYPKMFPLRDGDRRLVTPSRLLAPAGNAPNHAWADLACPPSPAFPDSRRALAKSTGLNCLHRSGTARTSPPETTGRFP